MVLFSAKIALIDGNCGVGRAETAPQGFNCMMFKCGLTTSDDRDV